MIGRLGFGSIKLGALVGILLLSLWAKSALAKPWELAPGSTLSPSLFADLQSRFPSIESQEQLSRLLRAISLSLAIASAEASN